MPQSALLIRRARGAFIADIARVLQTTWPARRALEDPRHWPSLRQLDRATAALGKRLVLRFRYAQAARRAAAQRAQSHQAPGVGRGAALDRLQP